MAMTSLTIQMDDELKEKAEILSDEVGLNMATVLHKYVEKCVIDGKIPTEVMDDDPDYYDDKFHHPNNQAWLNEAIKRIAEGDVVLKTQEELESMINNKFIKHY